MRTIEAFEDMIEQLTGALAHAGTALSNAAVAVKAEREAATEEKIGKKLETTSARVPAPYLVVFRVRKCAGSGRRKEDLGKNVCQLRRWDNNEWLWTSKPYQDAERAIRDAKQTIKRFGWKAMGNATDPEYMAPEAPEDSLPAEEPDTSKIPGDGFRRGFEAGVSSRLGVLRSIGDQITAMAMGKKNAYEVLDWIAAVLEAELKLPQHSFWPSSAPVAHSTAVLRGLLMEIKNVLLDAKQGKNETNVSFQMMASLVEKGLQMPEGAIWPKNLIAPNSPGSNLLEYVRRYEQLLAHLVQRLGLLLTEEPESKAQTLLVDLFDKYKQLGFPEDIRTMIFRHVDVRSIFEKVEQLKKQDG